MRVESNITNREYRKYVNSTYLFDLKVSGRFPRGEHQINRVKEPRERPREIGLLKVLERLPQPLLLLVPIEERARDLLQLLVGHLAAGGGQTPPEVVEEPQELRVLALKGLLEEVGLFGGLGELLREALDHT